MGKIMWNFLRRRKWKTIQTKIKETQKTWFGRPTCPKHLGIWIYLCHAIIFKYAAFFVNPFEMGILVTIKFSLYEYAFHTNPIATTITSHYGMMFLLISATICRLIPNSERQPSVKAKPWWTKNRVHLIN